MLYLCIIASRERSALNKQPHPDPISSHSSCCMYSAHMQALPSTAELEESLTVRQWHVVSRTSRLFCEVNELQSSMTCSQSSHATDADSPRVITSAAPYEGVDLCGLDVIKLAHSVLDLSLVGAPVHNKNLRMV